MNPPKAGLSAAGAVAAALTASVCCIGPAILGIAGLGGATSALVLAPYRPHLMGLSFVLLGLAFYYTYRRPRASCCADGQGPASSARPGTKLPLWLASLMIVLLTASSLFSGGWPLAPGVRDAGVAAGASSGGGAAAMTTTMTITGMTCGGCVAKVEERLGRAVGVAGYEVSLETGEARVSYEPAATTPEAIAAAISETGLAAAVKERPAP